MFHHPKTRHTATTGFTLIEMMVAVTIFSVITLAATAIFKTVVEGQRSAVAAQNIGESMRYALELAAREIRSAQKSDGVCKTLFNPEPTPLYKIYNKNNNDEGEIIYFRNKNGECTAYYLLGERLAVTRGLDAGFLTPQKIKIKNLKFNITDDLIGAFHSVHPFIAISMEAEAEGKAEHKQTIKMQTSISSRFYE